jgi:transcriptional regulator GlxA family with amidase domain
MTLAFGLRAFLLSLACLVAGLAQGTPKVYKCAPCDSVCDLATYDKPGACPHCAMPLVDEPKKVAILLFNGVQIIDFTGPYEMFGAAGCEVFTVAATRDPVRTAMGMVVVPRYSFADAPKAEVLVIPGGGVDRAEVDPGIRQFIRDSHARNQATLSVCNGAFILANTGLLDGLTVTTTRGNISRLAKRYPKLKVVGERRYVDNGRIVTAAGLSAGIDGALHVIEKLMGAQAAKQVAYVEEYAWVEGGR